MEILNNSDNKKKIALYVNWDHYNKNRIFEESVKIDIPNDDYIECFFDAKKYFAEKGISINTIDTYDDFTKCDYIIFFELKDIFSNHFFIKCLKNKLENKLIYFAFEGELCSKNNSILGLKNLANYFKYIFTWNDDLVDNKKFFKFNYRCAFYRFPRILESQNRNKLLTSISGNHSHSNPLELYSKRREIIDFFEKNNNFSSDYEFYGKGWSKTVFKNYKGTVESKYHTYLNYKFAVCFENSRITGYITEKILDCLTARIVPIYLGAPNIKDYIPSNCFIDYSQFDSIKEMYDFIKNMDDRTYNNYISNINYFLNSNLIKPFTAETVYSNLYKIIEYDLKSSEILQVNAMQRLLILQSYPIKYIGKILKKHIKTLIRKLKN